MSRNGAALVQRGQVARREDRQGVSSPLAAPQELVQPTPGRPKSEHQHAGADRRRGADSHRLAAAARQDRQGSSRWTSGKRRLGTAWPLTTE